MPSFISGGGGPPRITQAQRRSMIGDLVPKVDGLTPDQVINFREDALANFSDQRATDALAGIKSILTPEQLAMLLPEKFGDTSQTPAEAAAKASADKINAIFDDPGREKVFSGIKEAAFNRFLPDLKFQRETAGRQSKFALARQGLLGGRQQIDTKAELDRRFNNGVTDIGSRALAAEQNARARDENTRVNILNRASAGQDEGQLIQDALRNLDANSAIARSDLGNQQLSNFFTNASNLFTGVSNGVAIRRGRNQANQIFQPGDNSRASSSGNGTVRIVNK